MTDASEKIYAWKYQGQHTEGQWRSSLGACPTQGYLCTEYTRSDHALALVAAAYEAAGEEIDERHKIHMTAKGRNPEDYISDWSLAAHKIRALTPADAVAAQRARDEQTYKMALEAAAERARRTVECCQSCASVELDILTMHNPFEETE